MHGLMRMTILFLLCLISVSSFSQSEKETNIGLSTSVKVQKNLNRFFNLDIEEEVRLINNDKGFDRSVTSIGLDYALFDKRLKLGAYYAFIYLYNNDHFFEPRQRYYLNLSYMHPVDRFTFSWRGRFQGTYRDENIGEYKINPKYITKNKVEVKYAVWGRPWKPYISSDLSTDLNNPKGNYLTRIRYQGGTAWRINRTDYLDFFIRYDQYMEGNEPNVWSLGIGFEKKL